MRDRDFGLASVLPVEEGSQANVALAQADSERPRMALSRTEVQARYDALIRKYDRLIRAIVSRAGRRMGLRRDSFLEKDDIEQEIRLDLWKQIARGQIIEFPATYIYRATIRETIRVLRRNISREMVPIEGDSRAEQMKDVGDPFQTLAAKEELRDIMLGLRSLTPDRQSAVRAHLAGFQFQEIMVMYGWTYQKARNLIARGMADLRKCLNGNGNSRRPRPLGLRRRLAPPSSRLLRPSPRLKRG
jgi:RNA polymerase sigma-70 factor (ECF subfamily)